MEAQERGELKVAQHNEPANELDPLPQAKGSGVWVGMTRTPQKWLKPGATEAHKISLAVTSAGTYSLQGLRVAVYAYKGAEEEVEGSEEVEEHRLPEAVVCVTPAARMVQVVKA